MMQENGFRPLGMQRSSMIWQDRFEGDHLSIQENDEPRQQLFAESERDFFPKVNNDALTFEVDSQGRATKTILHIDGKDIPIKRLD